MTSEKTPGGNEDIENLIASSRRKIWDHITSLGIAQKIIEASEHSTKLENGIAYETIEFHPGLGIDSVAFTPRLIPRKDTEGSTQPVTLKLERIVKDRKTVNSLASEIWSEVTRDEMIAVATKGLEYLRSREQGVIIGAEQRRGKIPTEDIHRFIEQARSNLKVIEKLQTSLNEGTIEITFDELASLVMMYPKKKKWF